jgi:putative hydrolase of the HAD superfamily
MSGIRCVVLDVDDTLYLERDYVRSGFQAVGRWAKEHFDADDFFRIAWEAFERGARGNTLELALAECGVEVDPGDVREMVKTYRTHRPDIELFDDASDAIFELYQQVEIAVITDGPRESQRTKVDVLGLPRWCQPVVITAELGEGYSKPHPRAFELVERETGARGAECIYVADNPAKDFKAPKELGWQTLRIRRPGGLHRDAPSGADVDDEASDLADLFDRVAGQRE